MIRTIAAYAGAFLAAVLITHVLAVTSATQAVAAAFPAMGFEVPFGDLMAWIAHDITGMSIMLVVVLVAFGLALPVAALVLRWLPDWRIIGYVSAGFAGVICAHLFINAATGVNGVWATGTTFGLIMQGLCGAVGGYVFARFTGSAAQAA